MSPLQEVRVWDPWVRLFHWTLVTAFTVAYFTEGEDALTIHVWAGYVVCILFAFRLVWGVVGSEHARFIDFIYSPKTTLLYLKDVFARRAKRYMGHNPAGGWMIIALLIMIALISVTGLALYGVDEHAGPLAGYMSQYGKDVKETLEDLHDALANVTVALVALHVGGVILESVQHKESLVKAMITGRKRA